MQEDITAIKKGQPPAGFQIEKQSEKDIKPPIETLGPKVTPPPSKPAPEIKLGELEKTRPLPGMRPPSVTPITPPTVKPPLPSKAGLAIPAVGRSSMKRLVLLIGVLIIAAFLVWFFALRGPSAPEVVISPTPTPSASATPISIEESFPIFTPVSIALGAGFTARFDSSIDKGALMSSGGPGLYKISNPINGQDYTFSEFLGGLLIPAPTELVSAVYDDSLHLSVIYKSDGQLGFGFIAKLRDATAALTALGNWTDTITQDLKDLFGFDPAKAASATFLDNTYNGVAIRYRNFPDPSLTIDYAVVAAKDGAAYLVIANSREHIYSIIDEIK